MENKEDDLEDLNKAFEELNNENPLNLTDEADKADQDPETAAQMQANLDNFMNQMKNFQMDGDNNMDDLTGSLTGLLKGLTQSLGVEGKEGEELKNMFEGKGEESNIEAIAGKLLECFMNKELLYAPLVQCKVNYEQFFKKQEGKVGESDWTRFKRQYQIIASIIMLLDKDQNNKQKLMELFQEMQEYGQPPAGIASVTLPNQF